MSEWAWKNDDSLTEGTTDPDFDAYQSKTCNGETYLFGGPELSKQWLGASPDRVNLGRVELALRSEEGAVIGITEAELEGTRQRLDLRTGTMTSSLQWQGADVVVQTISAQSSDAVGFTATSSLLERGHLGIMLGFSWDDGCSDFQMYLVDIWNATSMIVNNRFYTLVGGLEGTTLTSCLVRQRRTAASSRRHGRAHPSRLQSFMCPHC